MSAQVLGIALRDGGAGEVSLGGVDAEAFVGDLTWLPVADGDVPLWSATLDAVASREAAAPGEARLAGGVLCGNQPLVWGVPTKLQNSLSRSNRRRFG